MSNTLEFKGTWSPALGAFPVITDDTTACYYLVSESGHVDGYDFNQGDWLIYVEEPISPTETHGKWYRSEGGIVQVAPLQEFSSPSYLFGEPGVYTKVTVNNAGVITRGEFLSASDIPTHTQDASTIVNFIPAARTAVGPMFVNTARSKAVQFEFDTQANTVSADVRVDGVTIVKNEFGQLKVADSIAHATGGVVDPSDGDMLFPPEAHTHLAADIADFRAAVRQALSHTPNGQESFFANTARSNAVVFNYDLKTATVSADVKVDNSTIVKNKFGQLVAIAADLRPHTHTIEDIAGIDIEDIKNLRPAAEQTLTPPSDGSFNDGLHNLNGYKINDAFDIVNVSLKNLTSSLTQLNVNVSAITPVPPPTLDKIQLEIWDEYERFSVARAGSGEVLEAIFDKSPRTNVTPRFAGSRSTGTLSAIIDGNESTAAVKVVEDGDYYAGQPAFQGWYKSLRAYIEVQHNLTPGDHTLQLKYVEGNKTTLSKPVQCYIAKAEPNGQADPSNVVFSQAPPMNKRISGVPSIATRNFTIGSLRINHAVGAYYNYKDVIEVFGGNPGLENDESFWVSPSNIPSPNGVLIVENIPLTIKDLYAQPVSFQTRTADVFGNRGPIQTIGPLARRYDPSSEANRVRSGSAAEIYPAVGGPAQCGGPWDGAQSLLSTGYTSELQLFDNRFQWPEGDFTFYNGPNYTNVSGTRLQNTPADSPQYRWFTLAYPISNLIAFNLKFRRIDGAWPLTLNRTIKDILMYAQVVGQTGWVDLNKPFRGFGGVSQNGDGALDVSKTTDEVRRITFGSGVGPFTGTLLIRVGIARPTNYKINADLALIPAGY